MYTEVTILDLFIDRSFVFCVLLQLAAMVHGFL